MPANAVADLLIDKQGDLWIALYGNGLLKYRDEKFTSFSPENAGLLYWSIDHLTADPQKGIWYLPHDDVASKGLGYFDGENHQVFNPPHTVLPSPSSLVVEPSGIVWVGTWFNGLYRMERK